MKGIADTGFIVAFARRNDQHHDWAVSVARRITEPLVTCEAVLAEAAFQLESSSYVLTLLQDEMLRLAFDCSRNLVSLAELARRYEGPQTGSSRPLFDTDERTVSASRYHHSDFRVYRRNRREVIPTHVPPQRP